MSAYLHSLFYMPAELDKLEAHINEALQGVEPACIGDDFCRALAANDRAGAISALASYYRMRPAPDIPEFGAGSYNRETADGGIIGRVEVVNIEHTFDNGRFDFLFNPTIKNPPVNHEWLWQLNRHRWWSEMARAFAETGNETYAEAFNAQLLDWVVQTDIPEQWNGVGSAWRTIECGLRLMGSWQTSFNLFRHAHALHDETLVIMLGSMHRQARHLYAHPTGGNWLLMETSGIYNFGALFPEFSDAEELRKVACSWVIRELERQILPDGLQYELSPDYHVVSYRCAANIYMTALAVGKSHEIPEAYRTCMYRMAMAAVNLSTPGFIQPRTNDCYTILTSRFTEFAATVFPDEPVFSFVNTNRTEGTPPAGETASVFLPWSGFVGMRSGWDADASYLCFDVGPLGMSHMHQDKLNINLFKGDEELIFDDGGGQYEVSPERAYGISAYDHNTVTVDGMGQSRREPRVSTTPIDASFVTTETYDYACATYEDTFGDSLRPATHRREVRFCKPSVFIVRDTLTSIDGEAHVYGLRFHVDTVHTKKLEGGAILAEYGKRWDLLAVPIAEGGDCSDGFRAVSAQKEPCLLGWYLGRDDAYNHPATTILMDSEPCLAHCFTTVLIPVEHGISLPTVERDDAGCLIIRKKDETLRIDLAHLNE